MFLPCTQTRLSPSLMRLYSVVALATQNRAQKRTITSNIAQRIRQNCTPCSSGREPRVQPWFQLLHLSAGIRYLYDTRAIARKSMYANSHANAASQRLCRPNATTLAAARALEVLLPFETQSGQGPIEVEPCIMFYIAFAQGPNSSAILSTEELCLCDGNVCWRRGRPDRTCQSSLILFMYTFWSGT